MGRCTGPTWVRSSEALPVTGGQAAAVLAPRALVVAGSLRWRE